MLQEKSVGTEKLELVKLLQKHNVVVRGGPEEGQKFIEALLVRLSIPNQGSVLPHYHATDGSTKR